MLINQIKSLVDEEIRDVHIILLLGRFLRDEREPRVTFSSPLSVSQSSVEITSQESGLPRLKRSMETNTSVLFRLPF